MKFYDQPRADAEIAVEEVYVRTRYIFWWRSGWVIRYRSIY